MEFPEYTGKTNHLKREHIILEILIDTNRERLVCLLIHILRNLFL